MGVAARRSLTFDRRRAEAEHRDVAEAISEFAQARGGRKKGKTIYAHTLPGEVAPARALDYSPSRLYEKHHPMHHAPIR
jgi:hypothetical protein